MRAASSRGHASFKEIAAHYERFRPPGANDRRRLAFMLERCPVEAGATVADVGCGTGKLLRMAAAACEASKAVGVDAEPAMLRLASGLDVAIGRAERLPLRTGAVDLAYCNLVFHLLTDHRQAAEELRRVVRPGGFAAIWTMTPEHVRGFYLNRYFPSLPDVDLQRFQAPESWAELLGGAGFETVALEQFVTRRRWSTSGLARAVRGRYISTLSLLPPAELEAGTAELEREAAADPGRPLSYPQVWCLVWAS